MGSICRIHRLYGNHRAICAFYRCCHSTHRIGTLCFGILGTSWTGVARYTDKTAFGKYHIRPIGLQIFLCLCIAFDDPERVREILGIQISSEFAGGNVFVNTNITLEIRQEAMARELIRRIQDMRKDLDLDVEANINVDVETSPEFKDLIVPQSEVISHEVRAKSLIITDTEECSKDSKDYTKEWDIEGEKVIISIKN